MLRRPSGVDVRSIRSIRWPSCHPLFYTLFIKRGTVVRNVLRLLAAVALLLLLAVPALAQGRVIIRDESGQLDQGRIERAARDLVSSGAEVAVYFVNEGSEDNFLSRLSADGLVSGTRARVNMLAIYVGLDNRYSSIRFGDGFNEPLLTNNNYQAIRSNVLNAGLSGGDFTAAVADTLAAVDDAVQNPPVPGGGTEVNVDPTPIAVGGVSVIAAAAGGYALVRRRRALATMKAAEDRFKQAREGAGTAIATLGQAFRAADERAEFDKVSYAAGEVTRLAQAQQNAKASFATVQTRFDDIGEGLNRYPKLDIKLYDEGTAAYSQITTEAAEVKTALDAVDARRSELDKLAQQAPEEIASAKKS